MRLAFEASAWEDYQHWQRTDRAVIRRINRLIDECLRDPAGGIGKPELLKHGLQGAWSRRINDEHRLVYRVEDDALIILQARYHYAS